MSSLLPILFPARFIGLMEGGGSTRPWQMTLADNKGHERNYVVKIFRRKTLEEQHAIAKEVIGNTLARQFGLGVPEAALVHISKDFAQQFLEPSEQEQLTSSGGDYHFCCAFEEGYYLATDALSRKYLQEYEVGSLYAFDFMIYNLDRGGWRQKPNLLLGDEGFLAIDHEQIFPFADNIPDFYLGVMDKLQNGEGDYRYQNHLFYRLLKGYQKSKKQHLFDEFIEYLTRFEPDKIIAHEKQLRKLNVSTGHFDRIVAYLRWLSQNPAAFKKILDQSIS